MAVKRFLDTNVLLYAYDLDSGKKREIARAFIEDGFSGLGNTAISVQVLQEFHVNFSRKGGDPVELLKIIEDLTLWPVIENTLELFGRGMAIQKQHRISLWDAMILAAAHQAGARELFTEDLNHGQILGAVRVINPFTN